MDPTAAMRISRAVPGDWAVVRQIRLTALADAPYAFGSTLASSSGLVEGDWRARIARRPTFIAWLGGEPVGMVAGLAEPAGDGPHGDEQAGTARAGSRRCWSLVSMWVSPQARGSGVADRLVQAVCDAARADGATRVMLWVTDVNPRARAFYERMGFRRTGARQVVRPEEPDHWEEERALDLAGVSGPAG